MPLTLLRSAVGSGANRWQATVDTTGASGVAVLLAGSGTNSANITSSRGNVAAFKGRVQVTGSTRASLYWCSALTNAGTGDVWSDPDAGISSAEAHVVCFTGAGGWDMVGSVLTGDDATMGGTSTLGGGGQNALPAVAAQAGDAIVLGAVWTSVLPGTVSAGPSGATVTSTPGASIFAGATAVHNIAAAGSVQASLSWTTSARWGAVGMMLRAPVGAPAPVITGPSGSTGAASSSASIAEGATTGPVFSISGTTSAPYPRLTGADAARFSLNAQGGGSWRADPVSPFNFEAPSDAGANRVYDIVLEASASVSQACAITLTDVNEGPSFTGPAIGDLTFVAGTPITPVAIASRFTDPEGLAVTASILEALPAGLSLVSGQLVGTPSAVSAQAGFTPRGTDPSGNVASGTAFTVTVLSSAASYSVTLPPVVSNSSTVRLGESFRFVAVKPAQIEDIGGATRIEGIGTTHPTTGVRTLAGFPSPGNWLVSTFYPATGPLTGLTGLTSRVVNVPA
jgi:hypothetical protein